jgi:GNAT superfamily N-acetyltransferase
VIYNYEHVREFYRDADKLLHVYFRHTVAREGVPLLDMNWELFKDLQEKQHLLCVTARETDDTLRGFVMYILSYAPHHKTVLCATCDILAVDLDYRNRGIGRMIIETAETLLVARGVELIIQFYRTGYDDVPLFEKLGFDKYEVGYMKRL